jgi:asparagine synthase (glutamine-hydrolysing)
VKEPVSRGILSQDFWQATVPWSIPPAIEAAYDRVRHRDPLQQMLYLDTKIWLPNNLLTRADKMTMAASIELRVPFLDHRLVEYAYRLPSSLKIRNGIAKFIEKRELARDLPPHIVNRRKQGFPNPICQWMRGPWLTHIEELASDSAAPHMQYFDRSTLARTIKEHRTGHQDHTDLLWSLLVFTSWHRQFMHSN